MKANKATGRSTKANPITRKNKYWNKRDNRTYTPLYNYYLPENYFDEKGYFSDRYK